MKRELNELRSRTINRATFIGTVINMPQASQGVGSGIFSIPWSSLFATKKGKEILIHQRERKRDIKTQAPFAHFSCLYPSPYDKAVAQTSRNIEKEDLDRGNLENLWGSQGTGSQLLQYCSGRGGSREISKSGCVTKVFGLNLACFIPLFPACSLGSRAHEYGKCHLPRREGGRVSAGFHTLTEQLLNKAAFQWQSVVL